MDKVEDSEDSRLVVSFLRSYGRLTQEELAAAAGMTQGLVSRLESGQKVPSEQVLRRLAAAVGVRWPLVVQLRRAVTAFVAAAKEAPDTLGAPLQDEEEVFRREILEPALLALRAYELEDEAK
jgi:transcriptional regulator with XRE-family HTH domain